MPVFKKRPKCFFSTCRQDLPHKSHHPCSSVIERPVPIECSASSKKLALSPQYPLTVGAGPSLRSSSHPRTFSSSCESLDHVGEMKGYRLVSCEKLSGAVGETAVCSLCASPLTVKENLVVRRGLVSKLMIVCTNTACRKEAVVSDPYASDAKSLNTRSVLGMQEIGRGRNGLESFCGIMDMLPPLNIPAYSNIPAL